jgi:hypothetical protein
MLLLFNKDVDTSVGGKEIGRLNVLGKKNTSNKKNTHGMVGVGRAWLAR